jgi:hypothetical protein
MGFGPTIVVAVIVLRFLIYGDIEFFEADFFDTGIDNPI